MACHAVQTWSLIGLVAAYLDLAIAYLLLCASAVAYLASLFLGFFGLSLPCPFDGMFLNLNDDNKDPPIGVRKLSITGFETNHSPNANAQKKKIHIEEAQSLSDDVKNAKRHLEKKLEEERIARATLYIELEKERSAAASAADEAMAMILCLQEEKASIKMEAWQDTRRKVNLRCRGNEHSERDSRETREGEILFRKGGRSVSANG